MLENPWFFAPFTKLDNRGMNKRRQGDDAMKNEEAGSSLLADRQYFRE
jgi:hypothetical protein